MVQKFYRESEHVVHEEDIDRRTNTQQAITELNYVSQTMPLMNDNDARFCAGCGNRILDRYYLMAADKTWHVHCLKCCDCQIRLDSELTCFQREGNIYCKDDYYRKFSVKCCAKCQMTISANEMVMRARDLVYHMTCFTCCSCGRALAPGDYFGMKDNLVYCRLDYENLLQMEHMTHISSGVTGPNGESIPFFPGVKRVQKGRPRKRKINPQLHSPEGTTCGARNLGFYPGDQDTENMLVNENGYLTPGNSRQKRVRTSFKHHQIRTMKSYFGLNHNPDAKDLKQLAQKTGLSKRVLQVWFQNARAKYRRQVLKQDTDKSESHDDELPDEKTEGSKSFTELNNHSPASLSSLSSTPSLTDVRPGSGMVEYEHSNSSISDLFTSTINTIN